MKLLFAALFMFAVTFSQNTLARAEFVSRTSEQQETGSPELSEALRLSAAVVNLFGERKYDEALSLAKKVLELREKVLGKDAEPVIDAVVNVAEIQLARRAFDEAVKLFERALASSERSLGLDSPRVAAVLDRLGVVYYTLGKSSQTEKTYHRSLLIREKLFGLDDQETARSIRNLAEFYQRERNFKAAEPFYQRLINIRTTGSDAEAIAEALDRYACLLRKADRSQEADKIEQRRFDMTGFGGPPITDVGIVNGKAIYLALPPYPPEARIDRVSGRVKARVLINESGKVISACAIEGHPKLWRASEAAAWVSTFSPTIINGKQIKVTGIIMYNFVAQ